jgi:psp operon transcriptional activator
VKKKNPRSATIVTTEALGQSEAFLEFQEALSMVAPIDRSLLLIGERGTGKELAATRLHYLSRRWQGPFVALNCAALVSTLIEAELFGHEKGAFTDARQQRTGRFEAADGGTLFLDEIGAIPMEVQEKILRVVEYGTFERIGSSRAIEVDVRIIGATNADLSQMAREGRFKQDLLDRLSFEVLFLPPLRERQGDVIFLANHFARRMAFEMGREEAPEFTPEAVQALEEHPWKGNIRELKNVVERAVYRTGNGPIDRIVFDPFLSPYKSVEDNLPDQPQVPARALPDAGTVSQEHATGLANDPLARRDYTDQPLKEAVRRLETQLLKRALKQAKYNQKKAAAILGLTYDQFRGLFRKHAKEIE